MSSHKIIDLRSDTVTKPTPAMLAAMMQAKVGDDVMGEDPSILRLEKEVAEILGKEAALFVPSGTMANQLAIHLHCRHGDSVLTEEDSHCFVYEVGGAAALSGVQFDFVKAQEWQFPDLWQQKIRAGDIHCAPTSLLILENTHNLSSGRAWSPELLSEVLQTAKAKNLATHCDGARLWNAAQCLSIPERKLCEHFDTVSVCFSKGLGAPVGSALAGTKAQILRARKIRKRWGGGMRQAGYLAEAARYALEHHRKRLKEDHAKTRRLFEGLSSSKYADRLLINFPENSTNMLYFSIQNCDLNPFNAQCAAAGLRMHVVKNQWLRAVVHLEITDHDITDALAIIERNLKEFIS